MVRVFFAILLAVILLSPAPGASAPGDPFQLLPSLYVTASDTTKVKKERVRKETPRTRAKEKSQQETSVSESEGGFWSDCLGSCLGDLIGSICSGIFERGGTKNESPPQLAGEQQPPSVTEVEVTPSGPMKELPFTGTIVPLSGGGQTVGLWNQPGGYEAKADVIESLPEGTQVRAVEYRLYGEKRWLLVSRLEPTAPEGWVLEKEVLPLTVPGQAGLAGGTSVTTPIAPTPESKQVSEPVISTREQVFPQQPRWQVGAVGSLPIFSQKAIREEYKGHAYQVGVETGFYFPHYLKLHLFIDYMHANGTPLFNYVVGTIIDAPVDSDLDILSFGLPIGQSFPFGAGSGFFSYGVGPALFQVREHALIYEYDRGVAAGVRSDRLTKWKGGGQAVVAIGGVLGGHIPISFQTRFALIPWSAAEEKSLTLDYLGTKDIAFFSVGLGIGFSAF